MHIPFHVNNHILFTNSTITPQFKNSYPNRLATGVIQIQHHVQLVTLLALKKPHTLTPISSPLQLLLTTRPKYNIYLIHNTTYKYYFVLQHYTSYYYITHHCFGIFLPISESHVWIVARTNYTEMCPSFPAHNPECRGPWWSETQ